MESKILRAFVAKRRFNTIGYAIHEDALIYLLQALPACKTGCAERAFEYLKKNKPLKDFNDELIYRDEFFARLRIEEVGKRCKNCELVDYMPALVDNTGRYLGYDPDANQFFLDDENHFNPFAKQRIQPIFDRLAGKFGKLITG
ncbi:unnamed protein product [Strongylus vulgaris]|uniref:SGNH domain-containing protein n=1 Tax=Strongylus vulgaris TaxID=40348 RepID=A0A3P7I005_STRVU|nr:unnamed protein product [Strongylus vulgaris]